MRVSRNFLSNKLSCNSISSVRTPKCVQRSLFSPQRCFSGQSSAKTDFGYQEVNYNDKEKLVREVFSKVATKYDVMNDLMSVGIHRLWKDELIDMINYSMASKIDSKLPPRHLDVAGGTGDIAFRAVKEIVRCYPQSSLSSINIGPDVKDSEKPVVVCDINPDMLAVGKLRASDAVGSNNAHMLGFVEGNAEHLPFPDNSFDVYTIAFGLRNVTNKDAAIRDAYRVLRKGGRLLVLEFSHLVHPGLQFLYDQYSFAIIPPLGQFVANDRESYQYLIESIRKFPKQEELRGMMSQAGFRSCSYKNLTFGIVAIHSGYKL